MIITNHGTPVSVNLPYPDMIEMMDLFDELSDPGTLALVREGRKAIKAGSKGIPAARIFKRVKSKSK